MFTISSIKYDPLILLTHHPQSDDGLTMDKTALSLKYQRKTNEKVVIFDLLAFRQGFYQNEENAKLFLNSYKEQIESLCEFIESNHADAAEKQCVLEVINCYCKKLLSPEAINNANNYLYFTHIKEVIFWLVKFLKCSDMAAKPKEQIIGLVMQAFLRCNKGDSELLNQLLLAKWCSESWQYGFMSLLTSAKELLIKDLLTEFLSGFKLDVVSKLVAKVSKLETPLLNQGLSHIRLSPHCLGLQTGIKKGLTQLGEKQLLGRGKPTHDLEKQLQQFFGEEFSRSFQYQLTQNYSLSSVILYMIEVLYLRLESLLASLNLTSLLTKKTNIDDVFITDGFFHYLEVFFLELVNGILNKIGSRLQYSINDFIEKEAEVSNLNFINIKSRLLRMLTTGITGFCSSIYQRPEFKTSQGAVYGICGVCFWVEDQQHQEHPLTIASLSGIDWWQYEHRMGLLHQAVINTENKEEILAFFTQQKNWQYLSQFNAVEIKTIIKTINSKIIEDPFLEQQLLRKFYQWLLCLTIEKLLSSSLLILLCELSLGASLLKLLLLKLSKADAAQLIVNLPLSLSVRLGAATIFQYLTPEQYQGLAQRFFDANDFYGTKSLLGKHCSPEQIKPTNGKTLSLLALASGASAVNSLGRCFKYDYKQVERGTNWTILMQAAEAGYTQIGSDNLVEEIIKTIPSEMIDNYLNRVNCWGMSAPMIAENLGHHSCLKTLLATEKVNLNLQDKQGRDVLGHAVISNSLEIVKCVMELGFNQTNIIRDQSFIAAIFEALVVESEEIFTYLLSKNALPTPCTVKGRTLLANILICNYLTDLQKAKAIDLVLTLTQVDINESSKGNKSTTLYTPLMIAAEYGSCEVIAVLLENDKIDIQVRNSKGETARDIALKAKNYSASLMIDKHTLKQKPAMSRFV